MELRSKRRNSFYSNNSITMDNNELLARREITKPFTTGPARPFMSVRVQSLVIPLIVAIIFLLTQIVPATHQQQDLCPKKCTCDDQNLEVLCKEPTGTLGFPHTLNPSTRRIFVNNAQMNQLTGLDYFDKLETLDISHNKFTIIDFGMIVKNVRLISINSSHNSIVELQDSVVSNALNDPGLNAELEANNDQLIKLTNLKKLVKISAIELILKHNQLIVLRNYTFTRFHRLQHLDLSYNQINFVETQSLFGLNKLETINLRGNRLTRIPTQALQSTLQTITYPTIPSNAEPSPLKHVDLSENEFFSIEPNAFNMLERAQTIHLESCSIHTIHEQAFNGLYTLNLLALDTNNLQEVPTDSFKYLGMLRVLSLSSNNFSSIHPDAFNGLIHLEHLQISDVPLKDLTRGVFSGLDSLRKLEITNNPSLTKIERGTFDNLPKLNFLNLKSNALTTLPDNLYERVPILDLRANPIHCTCETKWLTRWLKKFNESIQSHLGADYAGYSVASNHLPKIQNLYPGDLHHYFTTDLLNLTCFGPAALVGKPIIGLPGNKLECLEPSSELNVHIGFITLLCITTLLTLVCLFNCCRNKKHLFVMLKENLVQNHLSMVLPYSQTHLRSNADEMKKETQLYGSDYEPVEQANQRRPQPSLGPAYSVLSDQFLYYEPQPYSQYI